MPHIIVYRFFSHNYAGRVKKSDVLNLMHVNGISMLIRIDQLVLSIDIKIYEYRILSFNIVFQVVIWDDDMYGIYP